MTRPCEMATSFSESAMKSPGWITCVTYFSRTSSSGSLTCTRWVLTTCRSYTIPSTSTVPREMGGTARGVVVLGMHGDGLIDVPLHPQLAHEGAPEEEHITGGTPQPGIEPRDQPVRVVHAAAAARI